MMNNLRQPLMMKMKTTQKRGNLFPNFTPEHLRRYVKMMTINHAKKLQTIQKDENLWMRPILG